MSARQPNIETPNIEALVIEQFGEQWTHFTENPGYYGSREVLDDIFGPLGSCEELRGKVVAEVGAGSGRLINILADTGAKHVVAVEPSEAMAVMKENTAHNKDKITYIQAKGDEWTFRDLDAVISIGVLHHIHDPFPTAKRMFENLKPGGKCIIWLYGREGNELYLTLFQPLRLLTTKLPHWLLVALSTFMVLPLNIYCALCRVLPLPMRNYMLNHIARLDQKARRITIYDQLNPTWAKYYPRAEAEDLLRKTGFENVQSFHRHGYSWTVTGIRPV